MLRQIEWGVQNGLIKKNGVLPVTTLLFWKFCFSLGTSHKDLIWYYTHTHTHTHTHRYIYIYSYIRRVLNEWNNKLSDYKTRNWKK